MLFAPSSATPALVLVHSDRFATLWTGRAARLADEVEARLGDVFVTSATTGGRGATLDDALAAARFMGSPSVVVVWLDGRRPEGSAAAPRLPQTVIPMTPLHCDAEPGAIATAYRAAVSGLAATA